MLLRCTGFELTFYMIIIMKILPCGNNEFVPVNYLTTLYKSSSSSSVNFTEYPYAIATDESDKNFHHKILNLNKTKYFMQSMRRVPKPMKPTTCTPFFIRRIYSTRKKSKGDFNFDHRDFTENIPSATLVDLPTETFRPHRGKIKNFFFHKTIEPNTLLDYNTSTKVAENDLLQRNNISINGKKASIKYYMVFNSSHVTTTSITTAKKNITNWLRYTNLDSDCIDFSDGEKLANKSSEYGNHKTDELLLLNASQSPQFFQKILGFKHKMLINNSNKSTPAIGVNASGQHTRGGQPLQRIQVNQTLKRTGLPSGENNVELLSTSLPPYTIGLKNLLNFKKPPKQKASIKSFTLNILLTPKVCNRYTMDQTNTPLAASDPTSRDSRRTTMLEAYYNIFFNETSTFKSVGHHKAYCLDSDLIPPQSKFQGIVIRPLQNKLHHKCLINSTKSLKNDGNSLKNHEKDTVKSNKPKSQINSQAPKEQELSKDIVIKTIDVSHLMDVTAPSRTTKREDFSIFKLIKLVNFKNRPTVNNYVITHKYSPHASNDGPNTNNIRYKFENSSILIKDRQQNQKCKMRNDSSQNYNSKNAYNLPLLYKNLKTTIDSKHYDSNKNTEEFQNKTSNYTENSTSCKLNLIGLKTPSSLVHMRSTNPAYITTASNEITTEKIKMNKSSDLNFHFKKLLNHGNQLNTAPTLFTVKNTSDSAATIGYLEHNTSTETIISLNLEESKNNVQIPVPPISPTINSFGFDPGGGIYTTPKKENITELSQIKNSNDNSYVNVNPRVNTLLRDSNQASLNKSNLKIFGNNIQKSDRFNQWIFHSHKAKSLTLQPKMASSRLHKYIQSEDGNMFRWHPSNSDYLSRPYEASTAVNFGASSCSSNCTTYNEENSAFSLKATKNKLKSMFKLKRPPNAFDETTMYFTSGNTHYTEPFSISETEETVSYLSGNSTNENRTAKPNAPNYYNKKGNSTKVKIYKPFEKVLDKNKFGVELTKNISLVMNKSALSYDTYADNSSSPKNHILGNDNTTRNGSGNFIDATDGTNSILEFVLKPFHFLANEFKSNEPIEILTDYESIKNESIQNTLDLNGSLVLIAAANNATNSSMDEIHDSKVGWLDMLGGWFHCVVESYSEPNPQDIHFYLYTRNNSHEPEELFIPEQTLVTTEESNTTELPDTVFEQESTPGPQKKKKELDEDYAFEPLNAAESEIESSWFNAMSETKILIHGYVQDMHSDIIVNMKDAYLASGTYNVIVVDWSSAGDNACYPLAARSLAGVGRLLARLLDRLAAAGVAPSTIHLVGFSLGAHVAGHAGANLQAGLVGRITGLDPALPYIPMDPGVSLDAGDAAFVDVVHSAAGYLGQPGPTGHVDFYPNGGSQQPGCDLSTLGTCSHRRSALYFIESISSDSFLGTRCDSWHEFQAGVCANNTRRPMGELCPPDSTGKFYLTTASKEPFAQQAEEHAKVKKSLLLDLLYDDNNV